MTDTVTIQIEMPTEFTIKGAGAETVVHVTEFCDEALQYIFEYGFGRAHQDRANAIAHKLKAEKKEVDGDAILSDVSAALKAGQISRRGGGGVDPVTAECLKLVRPMVKAADKDWYKNASTEARNNAVTNAWDKIMADGKADGFVSTAKARIAKAAKEKAEQAELAQLVGKLKL